MEILFQNKTTYNKELYLKFNEFHIEKFGLKYELEMLLFILMFIYCIILNLKNRSIYLSLLLIITLIIYILWKVFKPIFIYKNELKSRKIIKNHTFTYDFYKYFFKITYKKKTITIFYFKLKKLYETNENYYLYIDKNHAFLLDKNNFTIGNSKSFTEFINKKCLFRLRKIK